MENQFGAEERSYRRGLVLGLTMAEIMILILFALLLIWMAGLIKLQKSEEAARAAEKKNEKLEIRAQQLQQQIELLVGGQDKANKFDDLFRELELTKSTTDDLRAKVASLEETTQILNRIAAEGGGGSDTEKVAARVRDELVIADKVTSQIRKTKGDTKVSDAEIKKVASELIRTEQTLRDQGYDPSTAGKMVGDAVNKVQEAELRAKTLQGRLQNAQQLLGARGKGTEKPACWADPVTGKPEYIFDVALQSTTVRIRDNALPHRAVEQARLPLQDIKFNVDLDLNDFRTRTRPLFQWSEKEECRFFVRVFDLTAAHEKARYKIVLRTVEEHFYKFEDLTSPWER